MSRESLILHLGRYPDKIDKIIDALNHKVAAPKLGEGDRPYVNMLEFCSMHGYFLPAIAKMLGKKIV